jgi:hypothetical protein
MFKKGDRVVKILRGGGVETASLQTVESVKKGVVKLVDSEHMAYTAEYGNEIDPVIPGFSSRIVILED